MENCECTMHYEGAAKRQIKFVAYGDTSIVNCTLCIHNGIAVF